ncbi:MAG: serine/threonine-protein kinase [Spirochaetales bacterium]|nr:serine/threonine-protein kinase [Spirochaetales bacterium]
MPKLPQSIGAFTVLESLGRGGTSQVYKASHPELKKTVVLKKLTLKGAGPVKERFQREADLMMGFNHEHIVKVYDIFKEGSSWIIVQEFVDGPNLEEVILKRGGLGKAASLSLTVQCLKALVYIHKKGVVHRDIKPSNIFLTREGAVKLGDFGIASRLDGGKGLTREGAALGTPDFMAPEQALDPKSVDGRADLYALALTWYEAWTGEPWPRRGFPLPPVRFSLAGGLLRKGARKNRLFRYTSARSELAWIRLLLFPLLIRRPSSLAFSADGEKSTPSLKKNRSGKSASPVEGQKGRAGRLRNRRKNPLALLLIFFLLTAFAGGGRYLYYQVLVPDRHVRFSAEIPYTAHTADWYRKEVKVRLYRDDGTGKSHRERRFLLMNRRDEERLITRSVYLRRGSYRIRVTLPDREEWHRVYLDERESRLSLETLDFPLTPLTLDTQIYDSLTGNLVREARIAMRVGEELLPLNGPLPVIPGKTTILVVSAPGYQDLVQEVRAAPSQGELTLRLGLLPEPARLVIKREAGQTVPGWKASLKIDGSADYLSWEGAPHWERIQPEGPEVVLFLAPGRHTVEIALPGEEHRSVVKEVNLKAGQSLTLYGE